MSGPRRLKACVERWPDCETGAYSPACCRFPKSCSADIYYEEFVKDSDLEDIQETAGTPQAVTFEWLARHDREVAAKTLRETAYAWQTWAWAKTPRRSHRVADRIAAAQYVCDWLRDRANEIEGGE